jgi:hypothetical protein
MAMIRDKAGDLVDLVVRARDRRALGIGVEDRRDVDEEGRDCEERGRDA